MLPGATTMPTSAVKMTSDMTRGFSSSKKSRALPIPPSGRLCERSLLKAVSDMKSASYFPGFPGHQVKVLRPGKNPAGAAYYLIRGSSENWWYGGGEDSVHSSVVAPSPHGLSAAFSFFRKACATPKRNTRTPKAEM